MFRSVMAILGGVVLGGLVVGVVKWLGQWALYPLPTGLAISDPKELALALLDVPVGAFLMVLLAWFLGALSSAALASWLGRPESMLCGVLAAMVMLAYAVMKLILIPLPLWFILATPLVFILGGGLGLRLWPWWRGRGTAVIA